jgi:integration host factor subunit alpha
MSKNTTTRAELLEAVYAACNRLTRDEAKDIVEMTLEEIRTVLAQGETVKLRGFGTFSVRAKTARVGRNPRTGKPYPIDARRVMTFRPSPRLIAVLNRAPLPDGGSRRLPEADCA